MAFLRDFSVYCIPKSMFTDVEKKAIGGICIVTSSIGFLGSCLHVKSLRQYRNRQRRRPSANPSIINNLALSDLVACLGVFALSICFVTFDSPDEETDQQKQTKYFPRNEVLYKPLITVLEVVTLYSYSASYIWTFSFALDMCFQIFQIECSMNFYRFLAWFVPLALTVSIELIRLEKFEVHEKCPPTHDLLREVLSYFLVPIIITGNSLLFWFTFKRIKQLSRSSGRFTSVDRGTLTKFKKRFLLMVLAFTICWLPNILLLAFKCNNMGDGADSWTDVFVYLEAILNPLQGIFNYIIYRKSFNVTATDIGLSRNDLPPVRRPAVLKLERMMQKTPRAVLTITRPCVQEVTHFPYCDEETRLLGSSPNVDTYRYIARPLGE